MFVQSSTFKIICTDEVHADVLCSWLSSNVSLILDGKYVVLPSGELQIRNVSAEDGFKTYKCRTKHRLTGETKLSATAGRLVITGKILEKIIRLVLK